MALFLVPRGSSDSCKILWLFVVKSGKRSDCDAINDPKGAKLVSSPNSIIATPQEKEEMQINSDNTKKEVRDTFIK